MPKRPRATKKHRNSYAETRKIEPKNEAQKRFLSVLRASEQCITLGPAGTGKTYVAAAFAATCLLEKTHRKIVITRPNEGTGKSLGYFPGTVEEKMAPWAAPFLSVIEEWLGKGHFQEAMKNKIEIVPLEVIRGRSFENTVVVCDEAQNATLDQLKAFVTRHGEGTKTIIMGDATQNDLGANSGLQKLVDVAERHNLPVPICNFEIDDIVRSGVVKEWVKAFHYEEN